MSKVLLGRSFCDNTPLVLDLASLDANNTVKRGLGDRSHAFGTSRHDDIAVVVTDPVMSVMLNASNHSLFNGGYNSSGAGTENLQ